MDVIAEIVIAEIDWTGSLLLCVEKMWMSAP